MPDFVAVFRALPTASVVVDLSSSIVAMNPAAQRLLGAGVDVGTKVVDVVRLPLLDKILARVADGGVEEAIDGDGFGVVVAGLDDGHVLLQLDKRDGARRGQQADDIVRDAEETIAALSALQAQHQRLLSQLEQAPVMMAIMRGSQHVFEIVNPLYEQYARRPLLGLSVAEAFPEVVAQGVTGRLDEVYRTGMPMVLRSRTVLNRADDALESKVFDVIYHPLKDGDVVTGIFILATDVTDRQLTQERAERLEEQATLLEAERQFLIESIPQQAWIAEADTGAVDFINERVTQYFGVPRGELLGTGLHSFVHDDDRPGLLARWQHSLDSGDDLDTNFRLRRHDGAWRWHVARAMAMRGDNDEIVKWFGTSTDIDDQIRALEELSSRAEFEQLLIGIVSHDLRNPLNAISLSAAVADGSNLDDKQRVALKRVTSATARATRLINDLLDFSQARSSGAIPVNRGPVVIADIVDAVVDERRAAHADCHVEVVHEHDDVTIVADHDRLAQLLDNLVGNAIQHSPKECVVSVRSRSDDREVVVVVENEGVIAAADLPKLFLPFQRGTESGRASAHSVGLGLFIAQKIAQAHGGRIDVVSTTTTRFTVTLPRS